MGAIALIGAILATDLWTAFRLSQAEGVGVADGSTSSGVGAGHERRGGPARVRTAVTILAPEDEVRSAFREFRWSAFDPRSLEASGQARLIAAPRDRGTELHLDYEPRVPVARLAVPALKLLGRSPDQKINDELRRFKALIETGIEVRSDKTPESFSARNQILPRPGQPPARPAAGSAPAAQAGSRVAGRS